MQFTVSALCSKTMDVDWYNHISNKCSTFTLLLRGNATSTRLRCLSDQEHQFYIVKGIAVAAVDIKKIQNFSGIGL